MIACRHGYIATVSLLLEEGALPELQNAKGENALHIVVAACHYSIAQKLIQHVLKMNDKEACERLVNQINNVSCFPESGVLTAFERACVSFFLFHLLFRWAKAASTMRLG